MSDRRVKIEARLRAATPGPWRIGFAEGSGSGEWDGTICKAGAYIRPSTLSNQDEIEVESIVSASSDDWGIPQGVLKGEDADLIAHAPADLRWLLDALAAAEERVKELERSQHTLADSQERYRIWEANLQKQNPNWRKDFQR